jgi:hypothetical protein
MRKTKFKKVDPETGAVSIYEAWVPEGHKVEGEVTDNGGLDTAVTASPAPGTVVEGVGVVNQEGVVVAEPQASMVVPKRHPPPPKRKAKGPLGRRKKVMFAPGEGTPVPQAEDIAATGTEPGASQASTQEGEEYEDEDEEGEGDADDSEEDAESAMETKSPRPAATEHGASPAIATIARPGPTSPHPQTAEPAPQGPGDSLGEEATAQDVLHEHSEGASTGIPISAAETGAMDIDPPVAAAAQAPTEPPLQGTPTDISPITDTSVIAAPPSTPPPPDATTDTTTIKPPGESDTNTASQTAHAEPAESATASNLDGNIVHFDDGEVDLLGSLEASLDKRGESGQEAAAPEGGDVAAVAAAAPPTDMETGPS